MGHGDTRIGSHLCSVFRKTQTSLSRGRILAAQVVCRGRGKEAPDMDLCWYCGEEIEFRWVDGGPRPIHLSGGWCSGERADYSGRRSSLRPLPVREPVARASRHWSTGHARCDLGVPIPTPPSALSAERLSSSTRTGMVIARSLMISVHLGPSMLAYPVRTVFVLPRAPARSCSWSIAS